MSGYSGATNSSVRPTLRAGKSWPWSSMAPMQASVTTRCRRRREARTASPICKRFAGDAALRRQRKNPPVRADEQPNRGQK